jgi:N-acetylglucosamine-6-sulfatase
MPPGKGYPYEADLNLPLIVRRPGISSGSIVNTPTAHIDLSPTFLEITSIAPRLDFNGVPIPLRGTGAGKRTTEHLQTEFWSSTNQFEYNIRKCYDMIPTT